MSSILPAEISLSVISASALLAFKTPEGWLWAIITATAPYSRAG